MVETPAGTVAVRVDCEVSTTATCASSVRAAAARLAEMAVTLTSPPVMARERVVVTKVDSGAKGGGAEGGGGLGGAMGGEEGGGRVGGGDSNLVPHAGT